MRCDVATVRREHKTPAPATPPFFLTEPVSDLTIAYFCGHLFGTNPAQLPYYLPAEG